VTLVTHNLRALPGAGPGRHGGDVHVRQSRIRIALVAMSLVGAAVSSGVASTPAVAVAGHSTLAIAGNFADPGFAKFGSTYYLYRTGRGFAASHSSRPGGGYTTPANSMPNVPSWVGAAPDGTLRLWAPHVFRVTDSVGALYVMYFTGYKKSFGANCVGIAYSRYPDRYFVATSTTICAGSNYYEAIDPSAYQAADGKRYLVYKTSHKNISGTIRAIEMDTATGRVPVGASRVKISTGTQMEAPSVIRHGGKVWMFTSRASWANCSYYTDVWRADTFWGGSFSRVRTIMTSASTGLCGPGGATVLQDGTTTRIAFHAWKGGTASSGVRQTWVGILKWNSSGNPYLY
jgi:hypothetical protein